MVYFKKKAMNISQKDAFFSRILKMSRDSIDADYDKKLNSTFNDH